MTVIEYHAHSDDYLAAHFESLRRYSPNTDIHIVGDDIVTKLVSNSKSREPYWNRLTELEAIFRNYSPNPDYFELTCIQRWFILYEYAKINGIHEFWSFDRDVLVFCDLETESKILGDITMTLPVSTFFCRNAHLLVPWLDWIIELYKLPGALESVIPQMMARGMPNVSDMNLAFWFWRDNQPLCLPGTVIDGKAWDANLNLGEHGFKLVDGSKLIRFTDGLPESYNEKQDRWMTMKTLHCHGRHKSRMAEYLQRAHSHENTAV